MLVDRCNNWHKYGFGAAWQTVMSRFAEVQTMSSLADGIHDFGGYDVNVVSMHSRLQSECRYEVHRHFCDVHMVLEGREWFLATTQLPTPDGPFDEARDIGFTVSGPEEALLTLTPGLFVLVFPGEAHMPGVAADHMPVPLRRSIAKIPAEAFGLPNLMF